MVDEKCGLKILVLVNAQSIVHMLFQLHDVFGFDSTVVINVLINISSPKLNNQLWREVGDSSQSFSSDTLQGISSE